MGAPPQKASSATATSTSAASTRLRREDYNRTKHDSAFSPWKILIGPSDWKNHCLGKEGAERYRTDNLPNRASCPGVYELAVIKLLHESDTETRKLGAGSVCVVYVGQSDNVRTRLQQYGRDGDHLENGCSNDECTNCARVSSGKKPRLFQEIFSRGYGIAYRWTPMNNKKSAEETEKQLLDKFDYAWNKERNGPRRKDDILEFIDHPPVKSPLSLLAKKFRSYNQKRVGIRIRTCEPNSTKTGAHKPNTNNKFIFSRIFRIKRVQPPVPCYNDLDDGDDICGVAIGHGSICTTAPVQGRKRCAEHKGMRVNGYILKLNTELANMDYGVAAGRSSAVIQDEKSNHIRVLSNDPCASKHSARKNVATICGFILEDGSPCKSKPFQRNKRCLEHKGRRVARSKLTFVTEI